MSINGAFLAASLEPPLYLAQQNVFIHSLSGARVIAPIALVNVGKGLHQRWNPQLEALSMYFGNCSGKEKWGAPLYSHCIRTVVTLQRLDYRNQRDVLILVLSVTVIHPAKAGAEDRGELTL